MTKGKAVAIKHGESIGESMSQSVNKRVRTYTRVPGTLLRNMEK